jgi:hypothetical protein
LLIIIPGLPSLIHVIRDKETRDALLNIPRRLLGLNRPTTNTPVVEAEEPPSMA